MLQKPLGTGELTITLLGAGLSAQCKTTAIKSSGKVTSREEGRLRGSRESQQFKKPFSNCLPPLQSCRSQCQHPCSPSYYYYIHFHSSNSQSIVRLFPFPVSTLPILLHNTFFEEVSSKHNRRNPNYHPWWKVRREKKIGRKSGTLQAGKNQTWFNLPQKSSSISVGPPRTCCPCTSGQHPPSRTPTSVRDKAPCSRLLLSRVMWRSISPGRLLPMTFLISKFAVT